MLIVNKDNGDVFNSEYIIRIYTNYAKGEATVKAVFHDGAKASLGRYNTRENAKGALQLLLKAADLGRSSVFYMPNEDSVKADRIGQGHREQSQTHHATGKKLRRHGGS